MSAPPIVASGAAVLLGCFIGTAAADAVPEPRNVVVLQASASAEVPRDLVSITLATARDGADAAQVQAALRQALDAALAEARKAARPGQIDVRTGNFSLHPRYAAPGRGGQPSIAGWQGTAELLIEGRDVPAIAALAGRISTMTVAHVSHGLSREQRERAEAEVATQAIARFRAKAGEISRQFGFAGYAIREVSVSSGETGQPPVPMMRAQASIAEQQPLPMEPGRGSVIVTVSGSVQMK